MIQHLKNREINKKKWDKLVETSLAPNICACSWYLDVVSPRWEALIIDDYKFGIPLPLRRFPGFSCLIQPLLFQQLTIYSSEEVSPQIYNRFFAELEKYAYLNLSFSNIPDNTSGLNIKESANYVLSLSKTYEEIRNNFSTNTKRNIQKAVKQGLSIRKISLDVFLPFFKQHEKGDVYKVLQKLTAQMQVREKEDLLLLYGVYSTRNELIAANGLLKNIDSYINLIPVSSFEGIKQSAMFLFMDTFIKEHAGDERIFDFEGSNIEGIARFFKGFGSTYKPYYNITKGEFPIFIRLLKNIKQFFHKLNKK